MDPYLQSSLNGIGTNPTVLNQSPAELQAWIATLPDFPRYLAHLLQEQKQQQQQQLFEMLYGSMSRPLQPISDLRTFNMSLQTENALAPLQVRNQLDATYASLSSASAHLVSSISSTATTSNKPVMASQIPVPTLHASYDVPLDLQRNATLMSYTSQMEPIPSVTAPIASTTISSAPDGKTMLNSVGGLAFNPLLTNSKVTTNMSSPAHESASNLYADAWKKIGQQNFLEHLQTPPDTSRSSPASPSTNSCIASIWQPFQTLYTMQMTSQALPISATSDGNNNDMVSNRNNGKLKRKRSSGDSAKLLGATISSPIMKFAKEAPEVGCDYQPGTSRTSQASPCAEESITVKKESEDDSDVFINVESEPANGKVRRDQKRAFYSKVKHLLKRGCSLTCNLCKKDVLTNHNSVTDHVAEHSGEKQVACVFCGWTTFEKSQMGIHMKQYHPDKKEQKYEDIRDLSKMIEVINNCFPQPARARHEYAGKLESFVQTLMERNITRIDCGICEIKIPVSKKIIEKHATSHPYFKCKNCGFLTNNEQDQVTHQLKNHNFNEGLQVESEYTRCTTSDVMTKVLRKCFYKAFQEIEKTHPALSYSALSTC